MRELRLDGTRIHDIPSFYAEVDRVFRAGVQWRLGQSLDALNDVLYGGYGVLEADESARVIWSDSELSRTALGVETTRAWLQQKISSPHFNKPMFRAQLTALDAGEGQTYFDRVREVFADHPRLELVLD